jgi:nicotinamidase-related amidase
MKIHEYLSLLSSGLQGNVSGVCGRILRGKSDLDFESLTDDPSRKVVMLMGPDGLSLLPGKSGYEMLVEIGYEPEYIATKLNEGTEFRLAVFNEGGTAKLANWDNVCDVLCDVYPGVANKLRNGITQLKQLYGASVNPRQAFESIEKRIGFKFADVDKEGSSDSRYMTVSRYRTCVNIDNDIATRAFLYFSIYLKELFSGDGYTYTSDGRKGMMEYIVANKPLKFLGDCELVKIDVNVPGGAVNRKLKGYELPLPDNFDPSSTSKLTKVQYQDIGVKAKEWAKTYGLQPAAKDMVKICLMAIDVQNSFCLPGWELYVKGAEADSSRLSEFVYRNMRVISNIAPTMDTHVLMQIFHNIFWVNDNGENPDPMSVISVGDIESGKWKVNPAVANSIAGGNYVGLHKHALHYAKKLSNDGKYALCIWPYHTMLGGLGHALVGTVEEAIFFHSVARNSQTNFEIKGGNPLTENYSVLRPEVLDDSSGRPIAQKNAAFIKKLLDFDVVVIAGQAKSHCVAWTIDDLLTEINTQDPSLAKKVYLLEDCTSPVVIPGIVDFTDQANSAFQKFSDSGMHIVKSTDPIESWPGVRL